MPDELTSRVPNLLECAVLTVPEPLDVAAIAIATPAAATANNAMPPIVHLIFAPIECSFQAGVF
jgi:hypothetical protein